jgi:hypothetical protein
LLTKVGVGTVGTGFDMEAMVLNAESSIEQIPEWIAARIRY